MRHISTLFVCLVSLILSTGPLLAQEIEHGHQAMQIFDKQGFDNSPQWVQFWLACMMVSFLAGLFFVKNHVIARWVIGGFFAGMTFGAIASSVFGVPNYSGFIALIHLIFWTPALYQLLAKRPFLGQRSAFTIWSGVITAVICFSFIFDIRDAFIYLTHGL
ncbi:MAG: hypothetical protein JKX81_08720 [Arenicella sp.]|nr:hypothetical protein [Arenicella sp.]